MVVLLLSQNQAATWQGNQTGTFTLILVGIGTTNTQSVAGVALTSQLTVGIVSCYEIYQDSKRLALESNVIAYAVALNKINPSINKNKDRGICKNGKTSNL